MAKVQVQATDTRTQAEGKVLRAAVMVVQQIEDATTDKAVWDALTAAQRTELNRKALRLLARLVRRAIDSRN